MTVRRSRRDPATTRRPFSQPRIRTSSDLAAEGPVNRVSRLDHRKSGRPSNCPATPPGTPPGTLAAGAMWNVRLDKGGRSGDRPRIHPPTCRTSPDVSFHKAGTKIFFCMCRLRTPGVRANMFMGVVDSGRRQDLKIAPKWTFIDCAANARTESRPIDLKRCSGQPAKIAGTAQNLTGFAHAQIRFDAHIQIVKPHIVAGT